jgi:hypothetical protein
LVVGKTTPEAVTFFVDVAPMAGINHEWRYQSG